MVVAAASRDAVTTDGDQPCRRARAWPMFLCARAPSPTSPAVQFNPVLVSNAATRSLRYLFISALHELSVFLFFPLVLASVGYSAHTTAFYLFAQTAPLHHGNAPQASPGPPISRSHNAGAASEIRQIVSAHIGALLCRSCPPGQMGLYAKEPQFFTAEMPS